MRGVLVFSLGCVKAMSLSCIIDSIPPPSTSSAPPNHPHAPNVLPYPVYASEMKMVTIPTSPPSERKVSIATWKQSPHSMIYSSQP